jgi:hypothetical protein
MGLGIWCCKTSPYNWNRLRSNIWRSTYLHAREWPMLSCKYAPKPYIDKIIANRNWCCKPRWRQSCNGYSKLLQKTQLPPNLTHESMKVHNLLLLFHLLTRCTKGKKPLIDYSQSHVVTSFEYLDILRRKGTCRANKSKQKKG